MHEDIKNSRVNFNNDALTGFEQFIEYILKGTDVVYIIIVSHGHDDYIENLLLNLKLPSGRFKIIVRDNKSSMVLKKHAKKLRNLFAWRAIWIWT
ncbi:hypothetical protein ACVV4A_17570 [Escherichia coli]